MRNDLPELWDRLIDGLQWLGRQATQPVWWFLESIEFIRSRLYDLFSDSRHHDVHDFPVEDEEAESITPIAPTGPLQTPLEPARTFVGSLLLQPAQAFIELAGTIPHWLASRQWNEMLLWSLPSLLVVVTAALGMLSGIQDRTHLSRYYLELGLRELRKEDLEISMPPQARLNLDGSPIDAVQTGPQPSGSQLSTFQAAPSDNADLAVPTVATSASQYAEMLLRKAHQLQPQRQSFLVIGTTLIRNREVESGRRLLRKVSPDHSSGIEQGHAMMAASYLEEFFETRNEQLLPLFEHHANLSSRWPGTPVEVLLAASDLHWQADRRQTAMELLELASKRSPTASLRLSARANQMGNQRLTATARQSAIENLTKRLEEYPKNTAIRIELAKLMAANPEGLGLAERLLVDGLKMGSSKLLSRALSEVYRLQFLRLVEESKAATVDVNLLEKSLSADPSNPQVAKVMEDLVKNFYQSSDKLQAALVDILASGEATLACHALLAELYLSRGTAQDARLHLEQIHASYPLAIKYAGLLAQLNIEEGRLEDAIGVARRTLTKVATEKLENEHHSPELMELLADAYERTSQPTLAVETLDHLIRFAPNRESARQKLLRLRRNVGNHEPATNP